MKQEKKNGLNVLNEEQEEMRMKVVDLELKARYWKAQHDIRFYTLQAEKIQPEYDAYLAEQMEQQKKAYEQYLLQMEENKEKGIEITEAKPEILEKIEE